MMTAVFSDSTMGEAQRRELLCGGEAFVHPATPASRELVASTRELIADAFGGRDPETAQHGMAVEEPGCVPEEPALEYESRALSGAS
ncbi:hypothetical protein Psi01_16480 [Planobispora siamensis]|uniref:Uncharacterized protein n=2 Tax=Planobispora siamensis TaxID=936338 RepID=A0A8J3SJY5_9ACTN|nr:hypothetical protein Psi01_16480 [Planobispora siamensis]